MTDIFVEVKNRAEKYFDQGYNCAQAVALSNIELLGGKTEGIIKLASGFGYGMSAGCTCGALSGGVMAIGRLLAGTETKGFDKEIASTTEQLHQRFTQKFGITCCRSLRKKFSLFKDAHCKMITAETAAFTLELLQARR